MIIISFKKPSNILWRSFIFGVVKQPSSQGLPSLPPLVVGTETLVAAGHETTQNLGGRKICWKGGATGFSDRPNVLEYPPTLWFWMDRWPRHQPQPGSLFQRLREAEKRDPGNEFWWCFPPKCNYDNVLSKSCKVTCSVQRWENGRFGEVSVVTFFN